MSAQAAEQDGAATDREAASDGPARSLSISAGHPPVMPGLWWRRGFYRMAHFATMVPMVLAWRVRAWGLNDVPDQGPVLFVGNHQSFLDPAVFGYVMHWRLFHPLARKSLWQPGLGWVLDWIHAVPLARGEADMRAVKRCIQLLNAGSTVLVYPEGTRSPDGQVLPFKSGLMLLIRRARPRIVPVAIEGSHAAWPRGQALPRTGRIGLMFDKPIEPEQLLELAPEHATELMRERVIALKQTLAARLRRYD